MAISERTLKGLKNLISELVQEIFIYQQNGFGDLPECKKMNDDKDIISEMVRKQSLK